MVSRRRFLHSASQCAFGLAGAIPSPSAKAEQRPNVLLIVSEDNGPQLGCYGDPYAKTPNLDRLAAGGARFQNAFVTYSVCSPSRASYLTDLYPQQSGQIRLATHKYAMYRPFPNIASLLKQAGYRSGIIGKLHVNPESEFPLDFSWNDSRHISFANRDMPGIAEVAGEFFRHAEAPFFLSVNYPDSHFPLHRQQFGLPKQPLEAEQVKPLPWVGVNTPTLREFTANYYNCLMRLDAGVGLLLDQLRAAGKAENTLIIYMSDHGPQFSRGKTSVYEGALRVPFLLNWPGHVKPSIVRKELVSELDILPTILKAVGIDGPDHLPGRALQPLLQPGSPAWREYIFGITTGSAPIFYYPRFSVRDSRYKLINSPLRGRPNPCAAFYAKHLGTFFEVGATPGELEPASDAIKLAYETYVRPPQYELYDLEADPCEFNNLADQLQHAATKERLVAALDHWQREIRDPLADPDKLRKFTEEHDHLLDYDYRKDENFRWGYLDYFQSEAQAEAPTW